jgi:hypothetical protein
METPIQKALEICNKSMSELELLSRTDYDKAQPQMEIVSSLKNQIENLISDEKEFINIIYSNCEKIKNS